jgi:drug/metabolite transporter (DMT)-like permease
MHALKKFNSHQTLGFLFVILSGVGFGFLGIFGRLAFQSGLSVGELLSFRFVTAAIILGIASLIFKPELIKISIQQLGTSAALGVFGYAVFSTLYFKSIEGVSVPLAALLLFTFPIFVNLGSHFIFKDRMTKPQVISLIIASLGLGILLWGPLIINSLAAVIYALLAAITYSIYVLVSGRYQKNIHPLSSSLYVIISAGIALSLFHQPSFNKISALSTQQLYIIMGIALVSTIGPLALFLAGLQRLPSSQASIIVMIEPVVAAVAAWFILDEHLSGLQLCGAGLVLAAIGLNAISSAIKK